MLDATDGQACASVELELEWKGRMRDTGDRQLRVRACENSLPMPVPERAEDLYLIRFPFLKQKSQRSSYQCQPVLLIFMLNDELEGISEVKVTPLLNVIVIIDLQFEPQQKYMAPAWQCAECCIASFSTEQ